MVFEQVVDSALEAEAGLTGRSCLLPEVVQVAWEGARCPVAVEAEPRLVERLCLSPGAVQLVWEEGARCLVAVVLVEGEARLAERSCFPGVGAKLRQKAGI